jgi:hypothetical protein
MKTCIKFKIQEYQNKLFNIKQGVGKILEDQENDGHSEARIGDDGLIHEVKRK